MPRSLLSKGQKTLMKKALFLIVFLASMCSASNEAFLYVDSKDAGLCLGLDAPDTQTCQNMTLAIDGTADHILYILPENEITDTTNTTKIGVFAFMQPISIITSSFAYVLLLCGLFAAVMYVLARAFSSVSRRRK